MTMAFGIGPTGIDKRDVALWSAAAVLALGAHLAGGWYASQVQAPAEMPEPAQSAVLIDLAPLVLAPETVPVDTPDVVNADASEVVEEVTDPEQAVPPQETVQADAPDTPEPELLPEQLTQAEPEPVEPVLDAQPVEEVIPDLVEVPLPEIAVAVPLPRPEIEEPKPVEKPVVNKEKPKPEAKKKPVKKPVEKPKEVAKVERKPAPSVTARKSGAQANNTAAPALNSGAGKSASPSQWRSRVNAHLARRKRSGGASGTGSVNVVFTIDRGGSVLSASVARSSGNPNLDQAALALVRRASPVPAPPPDLPRGALTLSVPVQFSR